jgi:hypothetical protein
MPDIAMCRGGGCPRRRECYRHRAVPMTQRQSSMPPPVRDDGSCDYFLELREGDALTDAWQELE